MMATITVQEVAPDVYAVHNRWVEGKSGIVLGRRHALLIDANGYPDETQAALDWLRERGRQPSLVVLTHGHGDHVLGGAPLLDLEPAPVIVAHRHTPQVIERQLIGWTEREKASVDDVRARTLWPTVTVDGDDGVPGATLWLGNKTVRLLSTPGHSEDGMCIYIEEDRLLFGGDTVVTGIVPAIGDGDSRQLGDSLRRLSGLDINVLVPGHGPVMRGVSAVRAWMLGWADYLLRVRKAVEKEVRSPTAMGLVEETIVDELPFERFVGDRLPLEKHDMDRRHRATVYKIVIEVLTGHDVGTQVVGGGKNVRGHCHSR
jgi:cyclase